MPPPAKIIYSIHKEHIFGPKKSEKQYFSEKTFSFKKCRLAQIYEVWRVLHNSIWAKSYSCLTHTLAFATGSTVTVDILLEPVLSRFEFSALLQSTCTCTFCTCTALHVHEPPREARSRNPCIYGMSEKKDTKVSCSHYCNFFCFQYFLLKLFL